MTSINPHSDDSLNNNHVSSAKNVPEIEDSVCRMCHCESELPNRPLYFPCKCDGSIRYEMKSSIVNHLDCVYFCIFLDTFIKIASYNGLK